MQTVYAVMYKNKVIELFTSLKLAWKYLEYKYDFMLYFILPKTKNPEIGICTNGFVINFIDYKGEYVKIEYRIHPIFVRDHL